MRERKKRAQLQRFILTYPESTQEHLAALVYMMQAHAGRAPRLGGHVEQPAVQVAQLRGHVRLHPRVLQRLRDGQPAQKQRPRSNRLCFQCDWFLQEMFRLQEICKNHCSFAQEGATSVQQEIMEFTIGAHHHLSTVWNAGAHSDKLKRLQVSCQNNPLMCPQLLELVMQGCSPLCRSCTPVTAPQLECTCPEQLELALLGLRLLCRGCTLVTAGRTHRDWMSTVMRREMRSQHSGDRWVGAWYCAATMRGNMRFSRVMLRITARSHQPCECWMDQQAQMLSLLLLPPTLLPPASKARFRRCCECLTDKQAPMPSLLCLPLMSGSQTRITGSQRVLHGSSDGCNRVARMAANWHSGGHHAAAPVELFVLLAPEREHACEHDVEQHST